MKQLKAYEYIPSSPAKAAIILLHGYGSNGADLFSLKDVITSYLGDDVAIIAFDAPFTCEMGLGPDYRQWFSLQDRSMNAMEKGASEALEFLAPAIKAKKNELNLKSENMILAGFSQGCMMSLYAGLRMEEPLAAVIGWSGMLIDDGRLVSEIQSRPPVQLWHGAEDDVVPPFCLKEAKAKLEVLSVKVETHMLPHCPHTIAPEALSGSLQFVKDNLSLRLKN